MPEYSSPRSLILTCLLTASTLPIIGQELPEKVQEGIRRMFAAQDADQDGQLTAKEMFTAALARSKNPERANKRQIAQAVHWEITRIDADGNRAIDAEELAADLIAAANHKKSIAPEDSKRFEGRFSQCSYNALATALIHFHGATPKFEDRKEIEEQAFKRPLQTAKFGGFHGWSPWTSYMVNSDAIEWNGTVNDLKAENFSLRPEETPTANLGEGTITVRYAPGERVALEEKFLRQLARGPVIMWTPYASVMSPIPERWKHVEHVDDHTDVVPFGPFTHAVTFVLKEDRRIAVFDGSTPDGVFYTDARTAVATSSAMTSFIRIRPRGEGQKTIAERCGRKAEAIKGDRYNVVVFRDAAD